MPRNTPSILLGGGHLAALWALGIVQPLLNLLGSNPDFFIARDNTGTEIVIFVLLLVFVPPAVATAVEAVINVFSKQARWVLHLFLVALLFSVVILQFMKQFADGPGIVMIVLALAAGIFLAWAYGYRQFLRSLTDILIPAPVIILVAFLFFSDASQLILSSSEPAALNVEIGNPAPVVMIVYDEFPAGSLMTPDGEINANLFPNFAELESRSNWYRNTVTSGSYTAIAVPSILSGKAANRNLLPIASDYPKSIFTLLGGTYRERAVEPITHLCPASICPGGEGDTSGRGKAISELVSDLKYVSGHLTLPESMGSSLPDISQSFGGFGQSTPDDSIKRGRARQFVADQLELQGSSFDGEGDLNEFLSTMSPGTESTFDFVHVTEPHYPWSHYPDGHSYTLTTEDFRGFITDTDWLGGPYVTGRARQAHLLEVGYADYLLGRVISRLKRDNRWNESMLVVVADHGGAMTKGMNRREAEPGTMGEITTVPLFVKAPGQSKGRIVDRPTCSSETLGLMAAALDTNVPWGTPACDRKEVAVDNGAGAMVRSPMRTVLAQRSAYVDSLAALFGGATSWDSVLKLGPNQDLIGTTVGSHPAGTLAESQSAGPEKPTSDYQPQADFNPILRQRGVLNGFAAGAPLAVAVNGQIAAVGEGYEDGSKVRYSILLPESSFRTGANKVEVFSVSGAAGQERLALLWSSAEG